MVTPNERPIPTKVKALLFSKNLTMYPVLLQLRQGRWSAKLRVKLLVKQKSPLRGFFVLLELCRGPGPVVYADKTLPLTSSVAGAKPAGSTSELPNTTGLFDCLKTYPPSRAILLAMREIEE